MNKESIWTRVIRIDNVSKLNLMTSCMNWKINVIHVLILRRSSVNSINNFKKKDLLLPLEQKKETNHRPENALLKPRSFHYHVRLKNLLIELKNLSDRREQLQLNLKSFQMLNLAKASIWPNFRRQ